MSIELVKKYADKTDEIFKAESKTSLVTNTDYDWTGAHSVAVWNISTVPLNDYKRNVSNGVESEVESISRFGKLLDLDAATQELLLKKDRSFIFNIDALDQDETGQQLEANSALAREIRNVIIPERDKYIYNAMVEGAGTVGEAATLSKSNIYSLVTDASEVLDDEEVPETERCIVVTPSTYKIMKQADIFDHTDVGAELRLNGVVASIDGMHVIKVPAIRLPEKFGFMIAHPSATTAPVKLEDYGIHNNTPLSSGTIVTGRICYDAFVLNNKKKGIYYQPIA